MEASHDDRVRHYPVRARFTLPDLSACLPRRVTVGADPPDVVRSTYFDTADLALVRAGVSLEHRTGPGGGTWTLRLPPGAPGPRHELHRPGPGGTVPPDVRALVTVYALGSALSPITDLRTTRVRHEIRGRDGELLAEIVDNAVIVMRDGRPGSRFREIEVIRHTGRKLAQRVGAALMTAGATEPDGVPAHLRAIGAALPDRAAAGPRRDRSASSAIAAALRDDAARILAHDPLVRVQAPAAGGDTPVHQMRVGARRMRTTLGTFEPLFDRAWSRDLRTELRWLSTALGTARDAEVLHARLHETAGQDPVAPIDDAALARIETELTVRRDDAYEALNDALSAPRYIRLVATLHALTGDLNGPDLPVPGAGPAQFGALGDQSARRVLRRLAARDWYRLILGSGRIPAAGDLEPLAPDEMWHAVRKSARQARYATEAAAGSLRPDRARAAGWHAAALAHLTGILGTHQDAVVAAQAWLAIASADPDDHALAVTAGRLAERERAAVRAARAAYPKAWLAARQGNLMRWLP